MADTIQKQADDLEALAHRRFRELSEAERKLLRATPRGKIAWCGRTAEDNDPDNDPAKADGWGSEREIRAELIRWLSIDREAASRVDPRGIWIHAAKVTGSLDLSYSTVAFPLLLRRCRLMDDARLTSAQIPSLNLAGSWTRSITADGVRVAGSVFLRQGFAAEGEVRLLGAQIGGDLDCVAGTFKNPPTRENPHAKALSADRVRVAGDVFLSQGFTAKGEVRLLGAKIGGTLDCDGSTFSALTAQSAIVKGRFFWRKVQNAEPTQLDLTNASVGAVADDKASWPKPGNLVLDGFTYIRISEGPTDAKTRLEWLARLDRFTLQLYRQLAKVLRNEGDDRGARDVLFKMEHRRRKEIERPRREKMERRGQEGERHNRLWYQWWNWSLNRLWGMWSSVLKGAIGYGQKPQWALWWLLGLIAIGFALSYLGYFSGAMAPTEKEAYAAFEQQGYAPSYYPHFHALVYSIEHSFPLVNLGQKDHWTLDPQGPDHFASSLREAKFQGCHGVRVPYPGALRWWFWFQILVGWLLATLFVAGLTGIVRSE